LVARLSHVCETVTTIKWQCGGRDLAGAARFARLVRSGRFSVVHQHYGGRAVSALARYVGRAQVVVQLHGRMVERTGELARPSVLHGSAVIADSQAIADLLPPGRAQVIFAGVERNAPTRPAQNGDPVIGALGRLIPLKGFVHLVRAFALLASDFPAVRLEIAGIGPELENLEHEAHDLGISDRVRFLGWVDDLEAIFSRWSVLAVPSEEEAFGLSAVEGMAAGLPVIASDVGGLPEVVGDAGVFVPPKAPARLAFAMRELLSDRALRAKLSAAGQERALRKFSAEAMAAQICAIYESLTS
jgi:glycosyltransferase involved in cell wall biosynthesis